jgi:hypothetical protein
LTKYASVGFAREGALAKQDVHESAHIQADLCLEWLIVWLKHRPFSATVETFFDVESKSPDRDVLVFAGEVVFPIHLLDGAPPLPKVFQQSKEHEGPCGECEETSVREEQKNVAQDSYWVAAIHSESRMDIPNDGEVGDKV